MTAYAPRHAFDVPVGEPQPTLFTPLAQFFRRIVAAVRRKPAPEGVASGAAPTALLTPPDGTPVLGNRVISEVRAEQNRRPAPRPVPPGWGTAWRDGVRILVPPAPVPGRPPWNTAPFAPVPPQARRPVNGRSMPSRPRRQPVYGEAPQLEVERAAAQAAGERARERYEPASVPLLRQVLDGLRCLDVPAANYRNGWQ